jgi:hypothetical protein
LQDGCEPVEKWESLFPQAYAVIRNMEQDSGLLPLEPINGMAIGCGPQGSFLANTQALSIQTNFDPSFQVFLTAHTHLFYVCSGVHTTK